MFDLFASMRILDSMYVKAIVVLSEQSSWCMQGHCIVLQEIKSLVQIETEDTIPKYFA